MDGCKDAYGDMTVDGNVGPVEWADELDIYFVFVFLLYPNEIK